MECSNIFFKSILIVTSNTDPFKFKSVLSFKFQWYKKHARNIRSEKLSINILSVQLKSGCYGTAFGHYTELQDKLCENVA